QPSRFLAVGRCGPNHRERKRPLTAAGGHATSDTELDLDSAAATSCCRPMRQQLRLGGVPRVAARLRHMFRYMLDGSTRERGSALTQTCRRLTVNVGAPTRLW